MPAINGMARRLRQNMRHGNRGSAQDANTVARALNFARGYGGCVVRLGADGGLVVEWSEPVGWAFGLTQRGNEKQLITVAEGTINIHGDRTVTVPETVITLTQGPLCWIYVEAEWPTLADVTIEQAPQAVVSDGRTLRWPLATFEHNGTSYGRPLVRHRGDINIAAAMRLPP